MASNEAKTSALLGMAENFGASMSPNLIGMWLGLLGKYTDAEVAGACVKVIENYPYKGLPPFAELKKYLPDGTAEKAFADMSKEELAEVAVANRWQDLLFCIQQYGRNEEPEFDETTAYVLNQMGGYVAACAWKEDSLPFKEKEFKQLWKLQHGKVPAIQASPLASLPQSEPAQALPPVKQKALPVQPKAQAEPRKAPFPCAFCGGHGFYNAGREGHVQKFPCSCQVRNGVPHSQCKTPPLLEREGWKLLPYDDGTACKNTEGKPAERNRLFTAALSSAQAIQEAAGKLQEATAFNPKDSLNRAVLKSAF